MNKTHAEGPWLTVSEAATYLNVSERTLRNRIRTGELTAQKFGPRSTRIHTDELDRLATIAAPDDVEAHITRILAAAPPLSAAQRTRLAGIFSGGDA